MQQPSTSESGFLRPQKKSSFPRHSSSPDFHNYTSARETQEKVTTNPPLDPNKPIIYLLSRDQIYHTGKMFHQTMEHYDELGVIVKLARTHYLSRFTIQIELDEIPAKSETYEFETTDTVREHIRKIDDNWLEVNINHNPLCQRMIREGKLILTEWENDWLKKDSEKFLEYLNLARKLYSQGTLVTEAIDMAVNAYFNHAMDRLKANAIVQGIRKRKGDEFIKSIYRMLVFEEVAILASCEDNIAYPVTFYGSKSTSFYVFQAVKFVQQHSTAGNTQMELVDIIIPHKGKEKTADAQPPTARKKSTGSSELTEKEIRRFQTELAELRNKSKKQEKFFQGQIAYLTTDNIDKFRSLTYLEDAKSFQDEVLEQQEQELEDLRTEVIELRAKVAQLHEDDYFSRNIIHIQSKELRESRIELEKNAQLIEEKDNKIKEQEEIIQKLLQREDSFNNNPESGQWRNFNAFLQQTPSALQPSPSPGQERFVRWRRNITAPDLAAKNSASPTP